jgi:hypothetical protein
MNGSAPGHVTQSGLTGMQVHAKKCQEDCTGKIVHANKSKRSSTRTRGSLRDSVPVKSFSRGKKKEQKQ